MFNFLKRLFPSIDGIKGHSEAVIIACYYNPTNSPYRLKVFNQWYDTIKHLNHRIVECVIGDTKPQLPKSKYIKTVYTDSLLWHKETLLNSIVRDLPRKYKYIFWVDADLLFTNKKWIIEGVEALKKYNIIQPFEYCIHLNQDEVKPDFNVDFYRRYCDSPYKRHKQMWRSFCSSHWKGLSGNYNYDIHGHVGFAWGMRRSIFDQIGLYDKALIGGADHIMAHAAAGQIPHLCITKTFTGNINEVNEWSKKFYSHVKGSIGYVRGDVYHLWHGNLGDRQYFKMVKEFTPMSKSITEKDNNGLYVTKTKEQEEYLKEYFDKREVKNTTIEDSMKMENWVNGISQDLLMNEIFHNDNSSTQGDPNFS